MNNERLVEQLVRYVLDADGKLFVIENVPARVNTETGEQFFAPKTVERIQQTLLARSSPGRVIETLVYEFAA